MAKPEVAVDASFLDSLTLDDIETIEDALDAPIDEVMSGKVAVRKAKFMRTIAFVLARRDRPDMTLEDAGRLTVIEVNALVEAVTARPTSAAG